MKNRITVDGETYTRERPNGKRVVLVVDRGWIFAGDIVEDGPRVKLDRAVWVFRWERIGFAAVVEDPTRDEVDIRPLTTQVDVPAGSEIFRMPVNDGWGLK